MNKIKLLILFIMFLPFVVNAKELEVGDYIELVPDAGTYTVIKDDTGYAEDQTITPNELTLWRIIAKNEDGTIDAVSEYTSSTPFFLEGVRGYANCINVLQQLAHSYKKEGYTKTERMFGYDGQTLVIEDTSYFDGTNNSLPSTVTTPAPTTGIGEEFGGGLLGDTLYLKDMQLVSNVYKDNPSVYGENGLKAYLVNDKSNSFGYVVSSRAYDARYYAFGIQEVYANGNFEEIDWYILYFFGRWGTEGGGGNLRPIITLESTVKIDSGEGNKDNPYTLTLSSKYNIFVEEKDNGTIEIDSIENILGGSEVVFKILPVKGYAVKEIIIKDSNNNIINYSSTNNSNEYKFIMPDSDVTITPVYRKIDSINIPDILKNPNTGDKLYIIIILIVIGVSMGIFICKKKEFRRKI